MAARAPNRAQRSLAVAARRRQLLSEARQVRSIKRFRSCLLNLRRLRQRCRNLFEKAERSQFSARFAGFRNGPSAVPTRVLGRNCARTKRYRQRGQFKTAWAWRNQTYQFLRCSAGTCSKIVSGCPAVSTTAQQLSGIFEWAVMWVAWSLRRSKARSVSTTV